MSSLPQPDAGFALALLHEVKNEPWTLILQLWIILFVGLSPILILFILFILLRWIAANTENDSGQPQDDSTIMSDSYFKFKSYFNHKRILGCVSGNLDTTILGLTFLSCSTYAFASLFDRFINSGLVAGFWEGFNETCSAYIIGYHLGQILLVIGWIVTVVAICLILGLTFYHLSVKKGGNRLEH
ncbi:unnamed protein product [Penicillium manginii]